MKTTGSYKTVLEMQQAESEMKNFDESKKAGAYA